MEADGKLSILFVLVGIAALSMLAILVFAEAIGPIWSNNSANVTSGTYYSLNLTYDFGIRWTNETNGAPVIRNVSFETNLTTGSNLINITQANTTLFSTFTNNTDGIYNITFTYQQLAGAGTYAYRWYATDNISIGKWNATDQWAYVIAQNPHVNFSVWINGTAIPNRTIEWPSDVNVTCRINLTSQNTFEMYRNGTKVGTQSGRAVEYNADLNEGVYNITCHYNETQNYTAASSSYFVSVRTTPMWSNNHTKDVSGTPYRPGFNFGFEIKWTDVASNLDNVTFETNLTTGGAPINITKAHTNLYTDFTNNSAGEVWWINFTQEQIASAGGFVYRWYAYDVNNIWNKTDQWVYVIAKNTSKSSLNISLYVNDTTGVTGIASSNTTSQSVLYNSSQNINITATINASDESVSITTNFTGWVTNRTNINNTTKIWPLLVQNGSYAVTGYYTGDVNYSVSRRTIYVNVSDVSAPQWSLMGENTSAPLVGATVNLTVYWRDGNLSHATLATNETGVWRNITNNYTSPRVMSGTGMLVNFTWNNSSIVTGGTTIRWRVYANDTYGKENMTDYSSFTLYVANGGSCTANSECAGGYCCGSVCQGTPCTTATTTTSPSSSPSDTTTTTTSPTTTTSTTTTTTTLPAEESMLLEDVAANEEAEFDIENSDALKIERVTITPNVGLSFMNIEVKEATLPSDTSAPVSADNAGVYKYIKLEKDFFTDDNISSAEIKFKVEASWISNNNIDKGTVALFRHTGTQWDRLDTSFLNEDATYVHYVAQTTKLSLFAIAGMKSAAATVGDGDTTEDGIGLPKFSFTHLMLIVGIIVVAVAFILIKIGVIEITMTQVAMSEKLTTKGKKRWKDLKKKYQRSQ
jgi:PGF-pre-PGF domain-containing protein